MKRVISAVLVLALIVWFSGCKPSGYISEDQESYNQAIEILRCLDEEDVEGLKSMFCDEVTETHDLDAEITAAMDFYQGQSTAYSSIGDGGGNSRRDNKVIVSFVDYLIDDILTDNGDTYRIATHSYLIYDDKPDLVGITYIKIIDKEGDAQIMIGEFVE